jgi:hypothetical protein
MYHNFLQTILLFKNHKQFMELSSIFAFHISSNSQIFMSQGVDSFSEQA